MKITKKYLAKIIKEEMQSLLEQLDPNRNLNRPYRSDQGPDRQHAKVVAAIESGLKAAGINPRGTKITNTRLYRGSGTGFTVEFDTDIGAMKFVSDPTHTGSAPQPAPSGAEEMLQQYGPPRGGLKLYDD